MTMHFISDNPLFLIGIDEKAKEDPSCPQIHTLDARHLCSCKAAILNEDNVVIFIHDQKTRMKVLKQLVKRSHHIAIMVDSFFERGMSLSYPVRISSRGTFRDIMSVSRKIRFTPAPVKIRESSYLIFKELYKGTAINIMVEKMDINIFNIYNLKKRIFQRYGLKNMNDKGILHCMEYIEVNRIAKNSHTQD